MRKLNVAGRLKRFLQLLLLVAVALGVHWTATSIHHDLERWNLLAGHFGPISILTIFFVSFLLLFLFFLYKIRGSFFHPHTRLLTKSKVPKREHLILFLSNISQVDIDSGKIKDGLSTEFVMTDNLEKDLLKEHTEKKIDGKLKIHWNWEMPLRGVCHHIGKLKSVTVICSDESVKQVKWFFDILNKYPELQSIDKYILGSKDNEPSIFQYNNEDTIIIDGLNFEDFDDLSESLKYVLRESEIFKKIKENQIVIDFTGGTKVTSVVAVAMTFNRKIKAQYVQTLEPWETKGYDILYGITEPGGLEL